MTSEFTIAVHALVYLNHKAKTQTSEEVALNVCANPARIRKVMAKLKKAGLVITKEGAEGGYRFEGKAEHVTLNSIAKAVDARLVSSGWRSGSEDMKCLIASGMGDIMEDLYSRLDQLCREYLTGVTIADIDRKIFGPSNRP